VSCIIIVDYNITEDSPGVLCPSRPYTESNGYNAICVIVDRLTKRAHFILINNRFSSKDMAQLLYDKVYPLHGLPLQIILDRGVQYSAELFQEWCKILGIESTMSTAYHPQTDSQTEHVN